MDQFTGSGHMPSSWTGPSAYEAVLLDHIARYVDRYAPGVLEKEVSR